MIDERLYSYINNERGVDYRYYSLHHIKALLSHFDNPHDKIKTIHIVGTNGKGSVAHMLRSIFMTSGYKTGLYTSPHLLVLNERITINNINISDEDFNAYLDSIISAVESSDDLSPTFFDIITVIAIRYFHDQGIDLAIMEAGLGGRLDSTNVITPLCSIITDISLDHQSVLGNTIEKITEEKSGVIKDKIPVLTSNSNPSIISIITKKADDLGSRLLLYGTDFYTDKVTAEGEGFRFDYHLRNGRHQCDIHSIYLNLPLDFQVKNASLAVTAALMQNPAFETINDHTICRALGEIVIPGRFSLISRNPLILFDPAHNEAALTGMLQKVSRKYEGKKIVIIFSLMIDKTPDKLISLIRGYSMAAIYYTLDDPRCFRPGESDEHASLAIANGRDQLFSLIDEEMSDNALFFFTGTFRIYGIAMEYITHLKNGMPAEKK